MKNKNNKEILIVEGLFKIEQNGETLYYKATKDFVKKYIEKKILNKFVSNKFVIIKNGYYIFNKKDSNNYLLLVSEIYNISETILKEFNVNNLSLKAFELFLEVKTDKYYPWFKSLKYMETKNDKYLIPFHLKQKVLNKRPYERENGTCEEENETYNNEFYKNTKIISEFIKTHPIKFHDKTNIITNKKLLKLIKKEVLSSIDTTKSDLFIDNKREISFIDKALEFYNKKDFSNSFNLFFEEFKREQKREPIKINNNIKLLYNLGTCLIKLHFYLNAIDCYKKALSFYNKNNIYNLDETYYSNTIYNLGICFYKEKQYKNSLYCFKKAYQINPNDKDYINSMIEIIKII